MSKKGDVMDTDPRAPRAYQLYIVEHMTLADVQGELHASRSRIKHWIAERGGEIRSYGGNRTATKTQIQVQCFIGISPEHVYSDGGSWYCASECAWTDCQRPGPCALLNERTHTCEKPSKPKCNWCRDMCEEPVTIENLWAYAKIVTERARIAKTDKARIERWHTIMTAYIRLRSSMTYKSRLGKIRDKIRGGKCLQYEDAVLLLNAVDGTLNGQRPADMAVDLAFTLFVDDSSEVKKQKHDAIDAWKKLM